MTNKRNVVLSQIIAGLVLLSTIAFIQSFEIQGRIVNGALSNPEKYRYYVQIRTSTNATEYYCGGSLISDRYFVSNGIWSVSSILSSVPLAPSIILNGFLPKSHK